MTIRWTRVAAPVAALLGPLVLYAATLAPDIGSIDSGELGAVAARLEIAHPTGYPLYTLLGRAMVVVLPLGTAILRLNLLSALLGALSCLGVFLLGREIVGRVRPGAIPAGRDLLCLGGALLWGVHPALWEQSVGNEVHALQAALVALVLWRAFVSAPVGDPRPTILCAYLVGLSLTNHMTAVFLVPGLLIAALAEARWRRPLRIGWLPLAVLLSVAVSLSLYLYLPIRARAGVLLDWGDPTTPGRFFRHIGGAQYRVWFLESGGAYGRNLLRFVREIASPTSLPMLAAAVAGCVALMRADRAGLLRLGVGLVVGIMGVAAYDIHDIGPYFLIPRLCLTGLAMAGSSIVLSAGAVRHVHAGNDVGVSSRRRWIPVAACVLLLIPAALTLMRMPDLSRRNDRFVRSYAESLLDRLPPNAILLSRHWDMVVSPLIYIQLVEKKRQDVTVVDPELLRRSWYFPQLRRLDPDLLIPIEDRVRLFLEQLLLFENGAPYDPRAIEERYRSVVSGIFECHKADRPVFHTPELETGFYGDWVGIPEALAVRMAPDPFHVPEARPLDPILFRDQLRHAREDVRRTAWGFARQLAQARITLLQQLGRFNEARIWEEALAGLPELHSGREELDEGRR